MAVKKLVFQLKINQQPRLLHLRKIWPFPKKKRLWWSLTNNWTQRPISRLGWPKICRRQPERQSIIEEKIGEHFRGFPTIRITCRTRGVIRGTRARNHAWNFGTNLCTIGRQRCPDPHYTKARPFWITSIATIASRSKKIDLSRCLTIVRVTSLSCPCSRICPRASTTRWKVWWLGAARQTICVRVSTSTR